MELTFKDESRKWMEASAVSEELVREAFHSPTHRNDTEVEGMGVRRVVRWFSDELIIHATGIAASHEFAVVNGLLQFSRLTVVAVLRITKASPVSGVSREMNCDEFEVVMMNALGRVMTPDEAASRTRGDLQFGGEPAVFQRRPNSRTTHVLTIAAYRNAFQKTCRDILKLPAIRDLIDTMPATSRASSILRSKCDELKLLLDKNAGCEEKIHQWLNLRENHVFLDPAAVCVRSKVPFGDSVSDFVIELSDKRYVLVEIEHANHQVFSKKGEPRNSLTHAIQQVRDWQRYIRDNIHTVRTELQLLEIDLPHGMVIIGRATGLFSAALGSAKTRARNTWRDLKARDPAVFTYDELIGRVESLSDRLEMIEKQVE